MSKQTEQFRTRLEDEKKRLLEELSQMDDDARPTEVRREGSPFGKREEEATESLELEKRLALEKQVRGHLAEVEHALKRERILPHHHEGTLDSGWLLIDYGDVIVHIFAAPEREYYQLDELWSEAVPIVRIQ